MSNNPARRLIEHNEGQSISTKAYRPWKLLFSEKYGSRKEARRRELYLKSGISREFIKRKEKDLG